MMTVDEQSGINMQAPATHGHEYTKLLRIIAQIISVIFHPLFIPVYVTYYLVYKDHYFFTGFDSHQRSYIILRVLINMVLFPALTVLLLKAVGFVKSIMLRTQRERIIPYITSGIFFFWMYLVFKNDVMMPKIMVAFTFGVFIASSAALIANIYYKISMHAIGAGGLTGMLIVILFTTPEAMVSIPLSIAFFLTGIICTSRLIVSDHSYKEVYMGLLVGFLCQVIAGATMM